MNEAFDFERDRVLDAVREGLFGAPVESRFLGRFEVRARLGEGASGVVYRAFDPRLERPVALKLLTPPLGAVAAAAGRRIEEEGRALAKLSHPNVVAVHDIGEEEGVLFLAMELVEGTTLRAWLDAERRSQREVLRVLLGAGRGLAAAHRSGLIHRDFKPENVILDSDGVARVVDFGLAVGVEGEVSTSPSSSTGLRGTPAYMAPELWRGEAAGAPSDQFAFAVVLYEALEGCRPFGVGDAAVLRDSLLAGQKRPLSQKVPRWLRSAIDRALDPDPRARFPSMDALVQNLHSAPRRRRIVAGLAFAATAAVGIGAVASSLDPACSTGDEHWQAVWNDVRRKEVALAFRESKATYATRSLELATLALDRFTKNWSDEYVDACEATSERHEQSAARLDVRMDCLKESLSAADEALRLLSVPEHDVVARAERIVDELPQPSACRRPARLLLPPAAVQDRAKSVRSELTRVTVLGSAGRYKNAFEAAETLVTQAKEIGWRPLEAEALRLAGDMARGVGKNERSETLLFDAYIASVASSNEVGAVRSALGLAQTLGVARGRYDDALKWTHIADAALETASPSPRLLAEVHATHGWMLTRAGDHEQALRVLRGALDETRAAYRSNHPQVATVLSRVGVAAGKAGLGSECEHHEEAYEIRKSTLGPDHPDFVNSYDRLAICAASKKQFENAASLYEKALSIAGRDFGPEHRETARICNNFAWFKMQHGDYPRAIELYRCAERAYAAAGHEHQRGAAVAGEGQVLYRKGDFEAAKKSFERAKKIYEAAIPEQHPSMEVVLFQLGNALRALDRLEDAERVYRRAIEIGEARSDPGAHRLMFSLMGLGLTHLAAGRTNAARGPLERAHAMSTGASKKVETPTSALLSFALARVLYESGERERAEALARDALAALSADEPLAKAQRGEVTAWLDAPSLSTRAHPKNSRPWPDVWHTRF